MKIILLLCGLLYFIVSTTNAQNLMVNGDLEQWSNPAAPTGWDKSENILQSDMLFFMGQYAAAHMAATSTKDFTQIIQGIVPGGVYQISYWYYDNDTAARSRIWSYWLTGNATLSDGAAVLRPGTYSVDSAGWKQYQYVLQAPPQADGFRFEVRVYRDNEGVGGQVFYDHFEVVPQTLPVFPEPSHYPTQFECEPQNSAIHLSWLDALGPDLPSAYLIQGNTHGQFIVPDDGVPQINDPDMSDGAGQLNILYGQESAVFSDLFPDSTYYFTIYPYANQGSEIDYKVDETAPVCQATIPVQPVLQVVSPVAGNYWQQGQTYDIVWEALAVAGDLEIAVSANASSAAPLWQVLNPSVPVNAGHWEWTIPVNQTVGPDYCIRLVALNGELVSYSDHFTLIEPVEIPQLVITEIMYNPPESGRDSLEFIELYNHDVDTLQLAGYQFKEGIRFDFPAYSLAPGGYLLIAVDSVVFESAFGVPAFQFQQSLSNSGEELLLVNAYGMTVDSLVYDNVAPWPSGAAGQGASLSLCNPATDNAVADNWSASSQPALVLQNGAPVFASPAAGCYVENPMLAFTEIMYNPPEKGADSLEFIELVNLENRAANLHGMRIEGEVTCLMHDVIVEAGEYVLIAKDSLVFESFYGCSAHQWQEGFLNNYQGELSLWNSANEQVDIVTYQDRFPWDSIADGEGPSLTLRKEHLDNAMPENWMASSHFVGVNAIGDSVFASPGGAAYHTPYDVLITEIMYNPPESGTDSLEFIELYNRGSDTAQLAGYSFSAGIDFVFPPMELLPGSFLQVARQADVFEQMYSCSALEWTSGVLSNSGERITLIDARGQLVDEVEYGASGDWPAGANGNGASLVFCDVQMNNDLPENWFASVEVVGVNTNMDTVFASPGSGCSRLPVAHFWMDQDSVAAGTHVLFTDASLGNPINWQWQFPGASPSSFTGNSPPPVLYEHGGVYDVGLRVSNAQGADSCYSVACIQVVENPVAGFQAQTQFVEVGNNGMFIDTSSVNCEQWFWSFEGGNPPQYTGQLPPEINYSQAGHYDVQLVVKNLAGSDTVTQKEYMHVGFSPVASFFASDSLISQGAIIDFFDASTAAPIMWEWVFEGGIPATSNQAHPQGIKYSDYGVFSVSLKVRNLFGEDSLSRLNYIQVDPVGIVVSDPVLDMAFYPNPAKASLFFRQAKERRIRLRAYNAIGVLQLDRELNGLETKIDISGWPSGVYYFHCIDPLQTEPSINSIMVLP